MKPSKRVSVIVERCCWTVYGIIYDRHHHWQISNQIFVATIRRVRWILIAQCRPCKAGSSGFTLIVCSIYVDSRQIASFSKGSEEILTFFPFCCFFHFSHVLLYPVLQWQQMAAHKLKNFYDLQNLPMYTTYEIQLKQYYNTKGWKEHEKK